MAIIVHCTCDVILTLKLVCAYGQILAVLITAARLTSDCIDDQWIEIERYLRLRSSYYYNTIGSMNVKQALSHQNFD